MSVVEPSPLDIAPAPGRPSERAAHGRGVAPLWCVLALTWAASFSSGIGWNGMFFITKEALHFSERENLMLGAALGLVYAVCAACAGRVMRILARRGWSLRQWLATILTLTACVALIPVFARSAWSIWVFGFCFQSLIGFMWPTIEAYLSGGRTGRELLSATGRFNLTWASALVVMMLGVAPILKAQPFVAFSGVALAQIVGLVIVLRFFPKHPAPAGHADAEEMLAHESYGMEKARALLRGFRILLMASYTLHAALTPILPHLLAQLGMETDAAAAVTATWLISRFLMFLLLERWHGWHGHWGTAVWSGALMVIGVTTCIFAPSVPVMVGGLIALGAGVGAVYACALYYAMEAGSAEVDAGGWHEAMIGAGYAIGPVAALVIGGAAGAL